MSAVTGALPPACGFGGIVRAKQISSDWWGPRLAAIVTIVWASSFVVSFDTALIVVTIMGFCAAGLGVVNSSAGLLGAGMLCTVDALSRSFLMTGGLFRYNSLNYLLIGMLVLGFPLIEKLKDTQTRLLQALALLIVMGVTITPDLVGGLQHVLNVIAIFGILMYFLRARHDPRVIYWVAVVNGVLSGVGGMVFFLQIDRMPWLAPDANDRFINANAFSYFPLTGLFSVCLAFPFIGARDQTRLGILAMVNLLVIFLTGSRGAMIVGLVCLLFLLFTTAGISRRLFFVLSMPVLALISLLLFSDLQQAALHRMEKLFDSGYSMSGRTSGRSDVALVSVGIFLEYPLGVGTGGFANAYSQADSDETAFAGMHKQAHSAWVKTLVENGAFGIFTLVLYVCSFAASGACRTRKGLSALGAMVTITLTIAFFSAEFQGKGLWFLASGATAMLNYPMASLQQQLKTRVLIPR